MNNSIFNSRAWRGLVSRYGEGEARAIVFFVLRTEFNIRREDFMVDGLDCLMHEQVPRLFAILFSVAEGTPVQYAVGLADFGGRHGYTYIQVRPGVLIPRPETGELWDIIMDDHEQDDGLDVLDIGTGSGCIAIMTKLMKPRSRVFAWDNSPEALDVARANAEAKRCDIIIERHDILNLWCTDRRWDVIVSNPPYILNRERKDMDEHVTKHEPECALFVPNKDPLRFYTPIIAYAAKTLRPGGALYLELNPLTAQCVADEARQAGLTDVTLMEDSYGKTRFMRARKKT